MNFISTKSRLPSMIDDKDWSENVLAEVEGFKDVQVMCLYYMPDDEGDWHYVWGNCYGDIHGDGEVDDDYNVISWLPIPKPIDPHHELPSLSKVHHLVFLTSGQCIIFDKQGNQISDLQVQFSKGETNIPLLKSVAEHAKKFTLCKFREWLQEMDK